MLEGKAEHVTGRQPSLFHGRACKRWKTDDVAGRIDVWNFSLKVLIHFQPAPRVIHQSSSFKIELITIRLSAYGIDKGISLNSLAALQFGKNVFAFRVDRNLHCVRVEKQRPSLIDCNAIALELRSNDLCFSRDNSVHSKSNILE